MVKAQRGTCKFQNEMLQNSVLTNQRVKGQEEQGEHHSSRTPSSYLSNIDHNSPFQPSRLIMLKIVATLLREVYFTDSRALFEEETGRVDGKTVPCG